MTLDAENLIESIMESLNRIQFVKAEDIPNIDLYMDQVTTFMDQHLRTTTRNPMEDKVLTKTMINNYAKNDLLPPPVKKKYSKEHVLFLIFIYYFKNVLSINDIQTLLQPIADKYFQKEKGINIEDIYEEVAQMGREQIEYLKEDVRSSYKKATELFKDAPERDVEFLQKFAFICLLSFDIYTKKLMVEKIVDELSTGSKIREAEKKAEKKATKKSPTKNS